MEWLWNDFFSQSTNQSVTVLALVAAIGLGLGRIKFLGVSIGITFVFFAGIIAGHIGIAVDPKTMSFAQTFGLVLFVYSLGLQVGPAFFSSLRKGGIKMNLISLSCVLLSLAIAGIIQSIGDFSTSEMIGLLSGAVTNTPMLGAAQQTMLQIDPANASLTREMAMACATAYPMGVLGVILGIVILRRLFHVEDTGTTPHSRDEKETFVAEFQISNPAIYNKTICEVMQLTTCKFVISRIWCKGKVIIPTSEKPLRQGDHLLVISTKKDVDTIRTLFGEQETKDWNKEDIDWNAIDSQLVSRRVLVTQSNINGAKLGALRLRNLYGINITRVNRAGFNLIASSDLRLQIGDKLTIVGEAKSLQNVARILGDEVKRLNNPNLISVFIGIALGMILGSLPIFLPGLDQPVMLGIAGGPIIVGILMGAFGSRLHLATYTTQSANLMLRQLGIVIYLAGLGIDAGAHFFDTVFRLEGMIWIGIGTILTIAPILIVGLIAARYFKVEYARNIGMLCGAMANPMALSYANTTVDGDEPAVAYATVYPLAMFVRVISAQIFVLL